VKFQFDTKIRLQKILSFDSFLIKVLKKKDLKKCHTGGAGGREDKRSSSLNSSVRSTFKAESALLEVVDVVNEELDWTTMTAKSLIFDSILEMEAFRARTRSLWLSLTLREENNNFHYCKNVKLVEL